jgi:UDP-glucose 4-epimerase
MRVVVTGGAGFIGAHTVRALLRQDVASSVIVVDDLSSGSAANLEGLAEADLVEGSILDTGLLENVSKDAAAIVHLAARPSVLRSLADPVASHTVNATGTLHVLEAARAAGCPHVIVASSSSVYGQNPTLPKSEDLATLPMSPYAASKLAAESYTLAYGASFGLPVLAFRLFNVFGPLQTSGHAYAAVVPSFVSAALAGEPLPVHGDGTQSRDFTYVGTVADVIADAVRRRVSSPGPVNLAFGSRRTLLDVIAMLEGLLGHPLERAHHAVRVGDVPHSQADDTRVRALFPSVLPVEFEEALRNTVEWMRATEYSHLADRDQRAPSGA